MNGMEMKDARKVIEEVRKVIIGKDSCIYKI